MTFNLISSKLSFVMSIVHLLSHSYN